MPRSSRSGYFVYILECCDRSLYTGYTRDLPRRLDQHQKGRGSAYVSSRRPFRLVYREAHATQRAAMRREAAIKQLSRAQKQDLVRCRRPQPAFKKGGLNA